MRTARAPALGATASRLGGQVAPALDVVEGVAPGAVPARFHGALVAGGAEPIHRAVQRTGVLPIVLTGGCLQDTRPAEGILGALPGSLRVYLHEGIPPGDGGTAPGQAMVADAMASR